MDSENLMLATLADATERFHDLGIDYMVTGSFAMAAYAMARTTMDIDIVLRLTKVSPSAFEKRFAGDYYVTSASVARAASRGSMFNIISNSTLVKVDCIVGRADRWESERFERRVKVRLGSAEFWVIGKEDLIVAKLNWAAASSSTRQFEDIAALMTSGIDLDLMQRLVANDNAESAWDAFDRWMTQAPK